MNEDDAAHAQAAAFTETFDGKMVTTDWVLVEVADAMSGKGDRERLIDFLRFFKSRRNVRVVRASGEWFERGMDLYGRRRNKEWSLTDCISITVMQHQRLTDVLTADHHFEQAGFNALLK